MEDEEIELGTIVNPLPEDLVDYTNQSVISPISPDEEERRENKRLKNLRRTKGLKEFKDEEEDYWLPRP